jgi:hemerythrin superfamily protein
MNVLELLKKDHSTVKSLFAMFDQLNASDHEKKAELFAQIRRELQLHSRAEQQIFYPAIKAVDSSGQRLAFDAAKEHQNIDELLVQISRLKPSNKTFDEKLEILLASVDSHVEQEEGEIFQFAEENCSEQQLEEMGDEIEERKRFLDHEMAA